MIIAVDFDDTLQVNGKPNTALIARLINAQRGGAVLILWTCRTGDNLRNAVQYCAEQGLRFNYINENAVETIRKFGCNPRKVFADVYIDDKVMR